MGVTIRLETIFKIIKICITKINKNIKIYNVRFDELENTNELVIKFDAKNIAGLNYKIDLIVNDKIYPLSTRLQNNEKGSYVYKIEDIHAVYFLNMEKNNIHKAKFTLALSVYDKKYTKIIKNSKILFDYKKHWYQAKKHEMDNAIKAFYKEPNK